MASFLVGLPSCIPFSHDSVPQMMSGLVSFIHAVNSAFVFTTLLQLTVIIRRLLFGGIFSTLDDVDPVLCMVLVFELGLTPLFLFGMFGLLV